MSLARVADSKLARLFNGVAQAKSQFALAQGDCIEVMRAIPDCSVDSIVDDPPSSIGFMGLAWDKDKGGPLKWLRWMARVNRESYRVLKPGGYICVWSLPRTSDLTGMALRLAGFEIIDTIDHCFGSGFPKSKDASKAIDEHFFKLWCKAEVWPDELLKRAKSQWKAKYSTNAKRRGKCIKRLTRILYGKANLKRQIVGTYEVSGNAATPIADKGGTYGIGVANVEGELLYRTKGATREAQQFDGYQTALKPAKETWWIARKPLGRSVIEGKRINTRPNTVAMQLLQTGTGAMNIDACRVSTDWNEPDRPESWRNSGHASGDQAAKIAAPPSDGINCHPLGRWPANLCLTHDAACTLLGYREASTPSINRFVDGAKPRGESSGEHWVTIEGQPTSQAVYECVEGCPIKLMDQQSGESSARGSNVLKDNGDQDAGRVGNFGKGEQIRVIPNDSGGASRFFNTLEWHPELDDPFIYLAKPSTAEREAGCESLPLRKAGELCGGREEGSAGLSARAGAGHHSGGRHNHHPTLKSIALMSHLITLVTPKGGLTLSRFAGSGTDLVAACLSGFRCFGIELEASYVAIARARIKYWLQRGRPGVPKPVMIKPDDDAASRNRQRTIFDLLEVGAAE